MSDKIFKLRDIHVDEKNRTRLIFWEKNLQMRILVFLQRLTVMMLK